MFKRLFISVLMLSFTALSGKEILIFGGSQPMEWLIRSVAPKSLCALNLGLSKTQKSFLGARDLTVIGGFNKGGLCMETLLKIHPAYVIISETSKVKLSHKKIMKRAKIRLVRIKIDSLDDYPAAFEKIASLSGNTKRGKELSNKYKALLKELKTKVNMIPAGKKKTVYYATGLNGLVSSSGLSGHSQVLAYAGAVNIIYNKFTNGRRVKIPFEKIIVANPDVIIIRSKEFYAKIKKLPGWRNLKAVKNEHYYLIPSKPVNWFDMPHTYMQLAGAWWLASILYPEKFNEDIETFKKKINKLFFNVESGRKEIKICENSTGQKY